MGIGTAMRERWTEGALATDRARKDWGVLRLTQCDLRSPAVAGIGDTGTDSLCGQGSYAFAQPGFSAAAEHPFPCFAGD